MKEQLYRWVYLNPPWSIIVPESTLAAGFLAPLPPPDHVVPLGYWKIEAREVPRTDEDES